jgi:hypothetical protein
VADLFAVRDDHGATAKQTVAVAAAPQTAALDELLADDERWYDRSADSRRAKVDLPNTTSSELELMLACWEQDATDPKRKWSL